MTDIVRWPPHVTCLAIRVVTSSVLRRRPRQQKSSSKIQARSRSCRPQSIRLRRYSRRICPCSVVRAFGHYRRRVDWGQGGGGCACDRCSMEGPIDHGCRQRRTIDPSVNKQFTRNMDGNSFRRHRPEFRLRHSVVVRCEQPDACTVPQAPNSSVQTRQFAQWETKMRPPMRDRVR